MSKQIDYTEIRDDRIRTKICDLMSEMLDNPDVDNIYPTAKFMWEMETFILSELNKNRMADQQTRMWAYEQAVKVVQEVTGDINPVNVTSTAKEIYDFVRNIR